MTAVSLVSILIIIIRADCEWVWNWHNRDGRAPHRPCHALWMEKDDADTNRNILVDDWCVRAYFRDAKTSKARIGGLPSAIVPQPPPRPSAAVPDGVAVHRCFRLLHPYASPSDDMCIHTLAQPLFTLLSLPRIHCSCRQLKALG